MDIRTASIFVQDQAKALTFYTDILGFEKVADIDLGEFRWLTVSAPGEEKIELLLEPNVHPAALDYQQAIYNDGIPAAVFHSSDILQEYEQLIQKEVKFKGEPVKNGDVWMTTFDDSCGNWIQLVQV